jgi:hypothetical protein
MSKVLTPARRARLEKLATYLEGLPKGYRHFGMGNFLDDPKSNEALIEYALKNGGVQHCGTSACAVGHGPAAGIFMPKALAKRFGETWRRGPIWNEYTALFIGPVKEDSVGGDAFGWLFGGDWSDYDDHHYGAAARIRFFLAHGKPPEGFKDAGYGWRKVYAPYRIDAKATAA